ncbi:NDUFAF3/Mth938 domain-containing protein [Cinara cedri]|uniref:NDUFAF3/Mth938 domain-containing protein n=1 Tax=Cinara cedri TaxID=506608 RepID=A0A5E4MAJ0_9HEMI|nr:NDUFAF3/Mth938 domain-containing protein [Cinara cedri]
MSLRNSARTVCDTVLSYALCKPIMASFGRVPRRSIGAYDNDGKTYVSMLNNNNIREGVMISSYSQFGFRLNNNFQVLGPIICFSNSIIAWYINDDGDVHENSLSLLFNLEPMPSLIVLGIGDNTYRRQIDKIVLTATKKYGCNIEVLPVDAALATYNFAISEQRYVAGAFIPPKFIPVISDDVLTANARHIHLYGEDLPRKDVWQENEEHLEKVNQNYKEFAEVVGAQKAADIELEEKLAKSKNKKKIK